MKTWLGYVSFFPGDSPLTFAGLSMLYSIVGVGLNAMPMAAFQDALTNLLLDRKPTVLVGLFLF